MNAAWVAIASIWSWFVLAATLVIWCPTMAIIRLVTAPFDPGRYWVGLFFRKIGVVMGLLNPLWRFRASGYELTDPRRPYVAVANHESFADILLISNLPWEMKWLSKAELFRIPVLGWNMRLAGDIPVERGTRRSAVQALRRCREVLAQKVSVIIFPEGTRSVTGEMLPFKEGAFRLAIDAQVPVLPIVVVGTRSALRKHDWRFGRSEAEVRVLPPISTDGMTLKDVDLLRDRVRDLISQTRQEMLAERRAASLDREEA